MKQKLIIIGAGGFGREVQWLIERINIEKNEWELLGFVDDNIEPGTLVNGIPVLGGVDYLLAYQERICVVCAVGNARIRRQIIQKLKKNTQLSYPNLIDPSVLMSGFIQMGEGNILCAGSILTVNLKIGDFVIVNLDTTIGHDVVIENFVTIYPSVNVSGCVHIGAVSEIGTGTQIIQGKTIGTRTIVGAGSVVIREIPDDCTAVGSPAKPIKYHVIPEENKEIHTVTVIGANGTMGKNLSVLFAEKGFAKVYMISRTIEKSQKAKEEIKKNLAANQSKELVDCLIPIDYEDMEKSFQESDLIIESVAEDWELKKQITEQIAKLARQYHNPDKKRLYATGTSGLSVTELAECFLPELRENYIGLHLFNPPSNMTLCELVKTKYTNEKMIQKIKSYLVNVLGRTVVEVRDSAAFLGNRIGFRFINEAMLYANKYCHKGGIDYIDAILGVHTGRIMPPLATANYIGLDIHEAIVQNLYDHTRDFAHEDFCLPDYLQQMIKKGDLGRKTGAGLYRTIKGTEGEKIRQVYDIDTKTYRNTRNYEWSFVQKMKVLMEQGKETEAFKIMLEDPSEEAAIGCYFLLKYILYSFIVEKEVAFEEGAADKAMESGFHWCPPHVMMKWFGGKNRFFELCQEKLLFGMKKEKVKKILDKMIEKSS